jgi:predicted metal-dependent hydrolase
MAPPAVIDYLVIHELCHLRHPNHSPAYWQEVSRWCADFRQHRLWLRQHGDLLGRILPR